MKVSDLMTESAVTIGQQEPIAAAARLMKRHNLGALPVCDDEGRLRGILTDRDIVTRCVAADMDPGSTRIREIMSRGVRSCSTEDAIDDAAQVMAAEQVRRLPVLENGKVRGMLALGDMARSKACRMEAALALGDISCNVKRK